MKRVSAIIMCCVLVMAMIAVPVFAAQSATFTATASKSTVTAGETFTVTYSVSEIENLETAGYQLTFDTDRFEYVKYTKGKALKNADFLMGGVNVGEKVAGYVMYAESDKAGETISGELIVVTFKVKDNAPGGASQISCNPKATDVDNGDVNCSAVGATVTVTCEHSYGAWASDGAANHKKTCSKCGDVVTEGHQFGAWTTTTPATCSADGVKERNCSTCGYKETGVVPATGEHVYGAWEKNDKDTHKAACGCGQTKTEAHKWNKGEVTTPASCNAAGVKTYTCTVCSETKTETVPATGEHVYGAWQKNDANTHKAVCACGASKTEAHKWNKGEVTTPADCKNDGVKTYTCSTCSETKTEAVPATGAHGYSTWTKVDDEKHTAVCSGCGGAPKTESHTWDAGTVTTPAGCDKAGVKTYTCTATGCGATKTEAIPATGEHTFGEWTTNGAENHKRTCSTCTDGTPEVETQAHNPSADLHSDATNHWRVCFCGEKLEVTAHVYDEMVGDAEGHIEGCECGALKADAAKAPHTWDEGVVTKKPTSKKEGEKTFTCTACGFKKVEKIDKVSTPATGDNTLVIPMVILAVLSACGLAVTVVARKRTSR